MSNMSGLSREVEGADAMHLAEQTAAAFFSPANDYQRPETGFTFGGLQPLASTTTAGESYSLSALPSGITDSNRQTLSDIAASVVPTIKSIEHEDAVAGTTLETPNELLLPQSTPQGPGSPRGSASADAAAMADAAAAEERANYLAWERSVARGGANDDNDSDEEERRLWHDSDDDRDRPRASSAGAASTFALGTVPSRPLSSGSSNESPDYVRRPPPTLSELAQNSASRGSTPVEPIAAAAVSKREQGKDSREMGEGVGVVLSSSPADDGRRSEGPAPSSKEREFERQRPTSPALTANSAQADPATSGSSSSSSSFTHAHKANHTNNSSSSSTNGGPGWVVQSGGASPYFPAGPQPSEHAINESKGLHERWSASSLSSQPQPQQPVPMADPTATRAGDRRRTGSTSRGGSAVSDDADEVKRSQEQQRRDSEALRDLQVETERLQSGRSTPQLYGGGNLLSGRNNHSGSRSCPPQVEANLPPQNDVMRALESFRSGVRDKGWHEEQDEDDVAWRRGLHVERREGGESRTEASSGTRTQRVHVQVTRAEWDDLRAAASERAVLFHEKGDLEQQLHALAENLAAAKARARQAEATARHLQVCLDCTSEDFAQYRAQVSWQHEQHASAAKAKGLRQACADPLLQEGAMAGFRKQQRVLEQALGEANAKAARNAKRRARLEGHVRVSESRCRQLELLCADVLREVAQGAPQLRWHARSAYEALRQVVTSSPSPLLHPPNTSNKKTTPPRRFRGRETSFRASSSSSSAATSFGEFGPEYRTSRRRNSSRREAAVYSSAPMPELAGSFLDQSGADFSRSRNASSQRPNLHLNRSAQLFSGSRDREFGAGGADLSSSWGGMYNDYRDYEDGDDSDEDVDYTGMAAEAADAEVTREAAANQRALEAELDATKLQLATETKRADALTLENKRLAQLCQEYASQYTAASFAVQSPLPRQKSSAY